MAAPFEEIQPRLDELKRFVLSDLRRIMEQDTGGNYAAVAVIGCACEALASLRYQSGGGQEFFKEYLLTDDWRGVGDDLYDALRNGIAHGYDTKVIRIPGGEITVGISWRDKPHLKFDDGSTLYINVQDLAEALGEAFDRYERDLRESATLRDRFMTRRKKGRLVEQPRVEVWRRLLGRQFT